MLIWSYSGSHFPSQRFISPHHSPSLCFPRKRASSNTLAAFKVASPQWYLISDSFKWFCINVQLLCSSNINPTQASFGSNFVTFSSHPGISIMPLPLSELCLTSQMRRLTPLPLLNYKKAFSSAIKSFIMQNNRNA